MDKDVLKNIDHDVRKAVAEGSTADQIVEALKSKYAKGLGMKKLAKHVRMVVLTVFAEAKKSGKTNVA